METKDYISLISAIIVALGWFVNGWLNRRKDIAQNRLSHRLEALKSIIPIVGQFEKIQKGSFDPEKLVSVIETARINIQLYGYFDEIEIMEEFCREFNSEDKKDAVAYLKRLIVLAKDRIRKELKIK